MGGLILYPPLGVMEAVAVASEGLLSTEVVKTFLQFRAPSTRKLYPEVEIIHFLVREPPVGSSKLPF